MAGHETTTNLIGNGMLALLRHPEQLRRLARVDPEIAQSAVEELLRFDPPTQMSRRTALADVELAVTGSSGWAEQVVVMRGAANRDPAAVRRPRPAGPGPARTTGTWRSTGASTSAWVRRWPGWRAGSR